MGQESDDDTDQNAGAEVLAEVLILVRQYLTKA